MRTPAQARPWSDLPENAQAFRMLTVKDVARVLAVSERYVYNELAAGRMGSTKIGRARRVSVAQFEAYTRARQEGGNVA